MKYSVLLCTLLCSYSICIANDGSLDPSFGTDGLVLTNFNTNLSMDVGLSSANAVALQPDGRIVVVGGSFEFLIARYLTNGSLDPSFGTNGLVATNFGTTLSTGVSADQANAVALQPDGTIIVAGQSESNSGQIDFALARYLTNGSLDPSFGTNGLVLTNFGTTLSTGVSRDFAYGVALQPDGRIVVAGLSESNSGQFDFALARYLTNGSLDPSFGTNGLVLTNFGTHLSTGVSGDQAHGVALQTDGTIVVAGYSKSNSGQFDFALARYLTNGALDSSFGTNGLVLTNFGTTLSTGVSGDQAFGIALQPDGNIVVAGYSITHSGQVDFALARYLTNGALDPSFGTNGLVVTNFGTNLSTGVSQDQANAVALQPDGRIVVVGQSESNSGQFDFALARYLTNGALDPSFGTNGLVLTNFGTTLSTGVSADFAYGVALQPDGKIVVVGVSATNLETDFAIARYEGTFIPPFIASRVICTSCGPIVLGTRGCKRSMIFNQRGQCVENLFGSFPSIAIIPQQPVSCVQFEETFTACNCI